VGRRRREEHFRAEVSLVAQYLQELMSARAGTGSPVPYDELPITQGACMLICDSLSVMELYPVDLEGDRVDELYPVLIQPNPDEDRGETIHKLGQSMFWTGNAFGWKGDIGQNGAVDQITVLNPEGAWYIPDLDNPGRIAGWTIGARTYPTDRVQLWKLNDDPRYGPLGRSPLRKCATALDTYGWAYKWLGDYFAFGGNPTLMFRPNMELPNDKIVELSNEWVAARHEGRPPFLPTWLQSESGPGAANEIAQVVEVLNMAAAEFARMMNLPVSLVNAPTAGYSLQYSTVADEFRRWLAVSLGTTWIARIERGFSALLPIDRRAKLDPTPLFRSDLFPPPPMAAPVAQPSPLEAAG
jgi:phage portal protein BeeE